MQVVFLGAGDAHRVALDASLHLDLAFLQLLDDLLGKLLLYADADSDELLHLVPAHLFGVAKLERPHIHAAPCELADEQVGDLFQFEIIVRIECKLLVLVLHSRIGALEIKAR